MSQDAELLDRYAKLRSEAAFAELVGRHVDLVYSAALRMVNGDAHRAQDLTQQVFAELARRAGTLARHPALTGWLYTTTRQMACRAIRSEQRRVVREQTAHSMNEALRHPEADLNWEQLRSVLDEAMHELNQTDRLAVLLRFFQNKTLREVGLELGLTENAARMRVERALEKLRSKLARKGATSTMAALALTLSGNAVTTAPVGFAAALAGASLTTAAATATVTGTTFGILNLMAVTNLKIGLCALLVAGTALTLVHDHRAWVAERDENESLRRQIADLKADKDALSTRLARQMHSRAERAVEIPPVPPPVANSPTNNLRARLLANPLKLTASQLDDYLKKNHRDASSLLAAYRVSHDPAMLAEAMQKYPNDAHVDFEALFQTNSTPEERRQWLTAFEKSAPDNALANYLSAANYFKAGQTELALQEMAAGSSKQAFQDYSMDRLMDDREAYLDAGYSPAEAEVSSTTQLLLPQLIQIKDLARAMVDQATQYQQAGDGDSAMAMLQMADALGARYAEANPAEAEVSQLVGMSVERMALGSMDPNSPYGDNGQTVQDAINQLTQDRATLDALNVQAEPILENISDQDYLTYKDRWMAFGEEAALRWLITTHGQ